MSHANLALIEHYECGPVVCDHGNYIISEHTVQEQSDANHVQKAYLNCGPNTLYTSCSSSHSTYIQQNVPLGIKGISFDF